MSNIIDFPGFTTCDIPVDKVLEAAKSAELESVFVIGVKEGGEPYFAGSTSDLEKAYFVGARFGKFILEQFD